MVCGIFAVTNPKPLHDKWLNTLRRNESSNKLVSRKNTSSLDIISSSVQRLRQPRNPYKTRAFLLINVSSTSDVDVDFPEREKF